MREAVLAPVSLSQTLPRRKVSELRELAKSYYVKGYTRMRKAGLVEAVFDALMDMGRLTDILYVIDTDTWDLFQSAAAETVMELDSIPSPQYKLLAELGYLECEQLESGVRVAMPVEIKALFSDLCAGGLAEQKFLFDAVHTYAQAAANLYGVISLIDFTALYNSHSIEKIGADRALPILLRHISVDASYCLWNDYLIAESYKNDEAKITALLEAVSDIPRYIPDSCELLRYAKADYFEETEHTRQLERYLLSRLGQAPSEVRRIVTLFHFACQIGASVPASLHLLSDYKADIRERELGEISEIVTRMFHTTRRDSLNGHTPEEILQIKALGSPPQMLFQQDLRKVGRNDPCPCGSGKKFKKCCGR